MKKAFVTCAAIAAVLTSWALLFMLCHWAGNIYMLLLALALDFIAGATALVCACKGLLGNKPFAVATSASAMLAAVGIWFTVMHWPFGEIISILALGILLPACAVWYAVIGCKRKGAGEL